MLLVIWILLGIYICMALYFGFLNNDKSIKFYLIIIIFQNFILILLSSYLSRSYHIAFSLIKEVMLYEMIMMGLFTRNHIFPKKLLLPMSFFLLICIKNLLFKNSSFMSSIISLRQLLIPIICFLTGFCLRREDATAYKILKSATIAALFLGVLGFFELLFLKDNFWVRIGFKQYLINKEGGLHYSLYQGVTRNFYTWDYFRMALRRLVSITADPLATAHILFLGFMSYFFDAVSKKNNNGNLNIRFLYMLFLFICCIMSLSKAVYCLILVSLLLNFYLVFSSKKKRLLLKILAVCLVIFSIPTIADILRNANHVTATGSHLIGLMEGFKNSSIWGNGLGSAGVMTSYITKSNNVVKESYVGTLVAQIGWSGLLTMVIFYTIIFKALLKNYYQTKSKELLLIIVCNAGLCAEMFFSESSVSMLGTAIYFILLGMAYKSTTKSKNEANENE